MNIRPIRNRQDHAEALESTEALWGAKPQPGEGDRLDIRHAIGKARRLPADLPVRPIRLVA